MRRFFISQEQREMAETGKIILSGTDVNHIVNVLRMGIGDHILLSATSGEEFECEIAEIGNQSVVCGVLHTSVNCTEPAVQVTLLQGIPKGEKMELIVQKSVELGVTRIVPVMMERTVVKFHTTQDGMKKQARWQKISDEASKQCGRGFCPEIAPVQTLKQALSEMQPETLALVAYENETVFSLKQRIQSAIKKNAVLRIAVLIGPEGGISPAEYETVCNAGFLSVSLGKRILRTETAGICVLSALRYEFED
ncbi:MAG: 16S rRNA (uracil(1498)-N(3))-methyltransferase [Clostridia bacterium]|nr:16S rRNA (uracil(1498)-N(3))-methyltransferase [Clostridia bacterium]